ncbi:MAG: hypothetical protein RSC66_05500, partial [Comamonas sp.]
DLVLERLALTVPLAVLAMLITTALALAAALLNAITTDAYARLTTPWAVWGVDAVLLLCAAAAACAARRLPAGSRAA